MTTRKTELSWWMSAEQECPFCVADFAILAEIYCTDCDRPVCPLCIVVIHERESRSVCPECQADAHDKLSH